MEEMTALWNLLSFTQFLLTEMLEGMSNYNNWKFTTEIYLVHENLQGCIDITITNIKKDTGTRAKIFHMTKF
jgi:glutaredoxin-related protein